MENNEFEPYWIVFCSGSVNGNLLKIWIEKKLIKVINDEIRDAHGYNYAVRSLYFSLEDAKRAAIRLAKKHGQEATKRLLEETMTYCNNLKPE